MSLKESQAEVWGDKSEDVVEEYWNNVSNMRRARWLGKRIKRYNVSSVFEIGIMGGRNLEIITKKTGIEDFGGIDVSQASIDWANDHLPDGHFSKESIYDMNTDKKYDVVFTAGVLIHIPPNGILQALQKCIDKANKYIIHLEAHGNDHILKSPEDTGAKRANKFQWRPDIKKYYGQLGYVCKSKVLDKKQRGRDASHIIQVNLNEVEK